MEAELQTQVAFCLTGRSSDPALRAVDVASLRPALLAPYRDLTLLRYDYPVVLVERGDHDVMALSAIVDAALTAAAPGEDSERVTRHVLRVEREIRAMLAEGMRDKLSVLWDAAAQRLGASDDELLRDSLARVRPPIAIDGIVADCDVALASSLLTHQWTRCEQRKSARALGIVTRLVQKLDNILRADHARSNVARSAENLRSSIGPLHGELFDFEAMSRVLTQGVPESGLSTARRSRIEDLVKVLKGQKFWASTNAAAASGQVCAFDSCTAALAAYRERLPAAAAVARAMAVAELELAGEFRDTTRQALFDTYDANDIDPSELALFPDLLVRVNLRELDGEQTAALQEIIAEGLPMRILVQTDDILDEGQHASTAHPSVPMRTRQLANSAMGLNSVFVLQSSSANLYACRDATRKGLVYGGPALFIVYSGAAPRHESIAPYLRAAAAMESRLFPAFVYDPSAGSDWASRFGIDGNPAVSLDYPLQRLSYEDAEHQRITQELAFTPLDFFACDSRYAHHFAQVPRSAWGTTMVPAAERLRPGVRESIDEVPYILMIDADGLLHRVIVDERLMREARRCGEMWRSLQEMGGVHNSHAERLLAQDRKERAASAAAATAAPESVAPPTAAVAPAASPPSAPVADAAQPDTDTAYIETPRCTSCNECTTINNKMFAYNENKQAYIKDVSAGTYAQLVEAAESCQVSIIHPGKPRDPGEPNLDELLRRAEAFR